MNKIKTIWEKISRKIIVYQCDNCKKVLSNGKTAKPQVSTKDAQPSGWVSFYTSRWRHDFKVQGVRQFYNGTCLGKYFTKIKCPKTIKRIGHPKS